MKTIHVNRAISDYSVNTYVEPVAIIIDGSRIRDIVDEKNLSEWQAAALEAYDQEAKLIVDALANALPGGTMDRVIARLLERRASLLVVPLFPTKVTEKPL